MDEAEELAPGIRTKEGSQDGLEEGPAEAKQAERHAEAAGDPEEELNEQRGRRLGMPQGCSEPRPQQAEIRIADEVLAILAEAALENKQIDKAMEAMGIAQNTKKERR